LIERKLKKKNSLKNFENNSNKKKTMRVRKKKRNIAPDELDPLENLFEQLTL